MRIRNCARIILCLLMAMPAMVFSDEIMGYDIPSHTEFTVPVHRAKTAVFDAKAGAGVPEEAAAALRSFGELEAVDSPTSFPYRVACKVISTFPTNGTYIGAGILIGPKHLLTSGVYVHFNGEWATSVEVIPGLDGSEHAYGESDSLQLFAWSAWITSQDYDDNLGLILLDRPLGAIAGYFDHAGKDDDSYFLSGLFNMLGYPNLPGTNGQQLHLTYGGFDTVTGNALGFTGTLPSGMGGAGVYVRSGIDDKRTVYGVLSHNSGGTTYAMRITETRADGIATTIGLSLNDTPDLVALRMTGAGPVARSGEALDGLSFTLYNDSSADFNAQTTLHTYLSTDDVGAPGDTEVASSFSTVLHVGAGQTQEILLDTATIPRTMPLGEYYLIAQAEVSDADTTNNSTDGVEALPITIQPLYHSADTDSSSTFALNELLRVIQFYNSGVIYCQFGTEDGYSPTGGDQLCPPHDSDYNGGPSWSVDLTELLRIVQFYNSGGYSVCDGTEDGYCPGLAP